MIKKRIKVLLLLLVFGIPFVLFSDSVLSYKNRGDRFEGVLSKPVSGYNLVLISALVDYGKPVETLGERVHLRFFLEKQGRLNVSVREIRYRTYYFLNKVKSARPFKGGAINEFSWPTKDVLRPLGIKIRELGAVVRLNRKSAGPDETVAPAMLYSGTKPVSVRGYLFSFKPNRDVFLRWSVYKGGSRKPLAAPRRVRGRAGRPFTINWENKGRPAGVYKLLLEGFVIQNNKPVSQVVRFYNRRNY